MITPATALEALAELRSVAPQYAYPRFDVLAKVITDELNCHCDKVTIERNLEPFPQGKLL